MRPLITVLVLSFSSTPELSIADTTHTDAEYVLACRAFAASFGGYDIEIVEGLTAKDGYARASYLRPSDQSKWVYACKFDGDRLIWAADENGRLGRWRTEENIRYIVTDSRVTIQQIWGDNSMTEDTYER